MSEVEFEVINPADAIALNGRYWPADTPSAMISIVHGLGEHSGRYEGVAQMLNRHGISVCAIDLHGHGKTPGKRGVCRDFSLMHGDVTALLSYAKAQAPDVPQFLFGHSMGGGIVLSYALDNPELDLTGVIAQAPLIAIVDAPSAALTPIMKFLRKLAPSFIIKSKLDGAKISSLPDEQRAYEDDPLNHSHLGVGLALDMLSTGESIAARAEQFAYPLLLTHGDKDVLTDYRSSVNFAAKAPKCTFIPYPNSAHEVHNDFCRDQVYADLSGWIMEHFATA